MSNRKTLLAASILASLCLSVSVSAQDNPSGSDATSPTASDKPVTELQDITVTGIRASLAKSIDTKRNANAVVEAITAEDIGKFPSTNVAEAISQIPGVTIDRRFGQGERVSIDGTDPSLNLTFLDGHPVAQTPWLLGEQPSRGFDYTQLAPEVLGRLEIYKSSEARLPEGSIGGTVIMHTRQPFDLAPNTLSGSVGTVYNDQARRGRPNASVLYSWHNPDSTFGVTTSVSHYEEQVDRQGIEIFGYSPVSDLTTNPNVAAQVANGQIQPGDQMAQEVNGAYFQQHRQRDSVTLGVQWKPLDRLQFDLNGLYVRENFQNWNQSLYAITSDHINGITGLTSNGNGQITGGHSCGTDTVGCTDHAVTILDENVRKSVVTTKGLDLKGAYKGDSWGLSGQGGFSNSGNPHAEAALFSPRYYGGYNWDVRKGMRFDDPVAARDPAHWGLDNNSYYTRTPSHTRDVYGQLDFSKDFDGAFNQLQAGVRYTKHTENSSWLRYYVPASADGTTVADVGGAGYTDIFGAFSGMSDDYRRHLQIERGKARNWVVDQTLGQGVPADPSTYLNNTWNLDQQAKAAYAQLNFASDNWHGNVGLRYVHTTIASLGYEAGADAVLPPPAGSAQRSSRTFNDWLPSINVVYDTNEAMVLRGSVAKVIAWAPYNQLVNNTSLVDDQLTGSGGSNKLDPYTSYNFNVSGEWYFNQQSMLALSVFYKHILNYIETDAGIERQFNSLFGSDTYDALAARPPTPGRQGNCDAQGFCDYSVLRPANGGAATVRGFTLSYQQPFGDSGFGITTNYTYSHGKTDAGEDLPYNSTSAFNVSPYFEKGAFTARINYGRRGRYLAGGYVAGAPPASVDSYTNVSASLGWQFNDNFSLSLDGMNLLNEKYYQFDRDSSRAWNNYSTGRRYLASAHFKF